MAMSGMVLILVMLTGNQSNELLSYVDTNAYWQAKGVAVTVENMTKELAPTDKPADGATPARRLMAIRALGELKDAKATETLNGVAKSQTPFEAEYAARALSEIKGEAYTRVAPAADELAKDIMILPKGCGVVAHVRLAGGPRMSLKEALDKLPADLGGDKEQLGKAFTEGLTKLAEQSGNMRVEAVTLGVSGTAGDRVEGMFVVVIARGQYDRASVLELLKTADPQAKVETVDGVEVLSASNREFNCILDKGERFILVGGPVMEGNGVAILPVKEVVAGLKTGKGGITEEAEMVKLIESAGLAGEIFAVMKVTDSFREAPFLAPFDTMVLTTKTVGDGTEVKIVGTGKDAEAVKTAATMVENVQKELALHEGELPPEIKSAIGPIWDGFQGTKATTDKATLTITGKIVKGKGLGVVMQAFMMMMMIMKG